MRVTVEMVWAEPRSEFEMGRVFTYFTPHQCAEGLYLEKLKAGGDPADFEVYEIDDDEWGVFNTQEGILLAYFVSRKVVQPRGPSLQQSDHHRFCPWARAANPSRDVEECVCDSLRNADMLEAGDRVRVLVQTGEEEGR